MMKKVGRWTAAAMTMLLVAGTLAAQGGPRGDAEGLEREMAALNRTLTQITQLLETLIESRRLELTGKQVEFSAARLLQQEQELRELRKTRQKLDDEQRRTESERARIEEQFEAGEIRNRPVSEIERLTKTLETAIAQYAERIRALDRQIVELENEVAQTQQEIEDWQNHMSRQLGGR